MDTEERLRNETKKWEEKLEQRLDTVSVADSDGEELLRNATAYLQDTAHFKQEGDWVRAFEAVVWGWSWLEIGERLDLLDD